MKTRTWLLPTLVLLPVGLYGLQYLLQVRTPLSASPPSAAGAHEFQVGNLSTHYYDGATSTPGYSLHATTAARYRNASGERIELSGGVHGQRQEADGHSTDFSTEALTIHPAARYVETDTPVLLRSGSTTIRGGALTADFDSGLTILKSHAGQRIQASVTAPSPSR